MTIGKIVSELARREGKKSQVTVGNIRELLGHLGDMMWENPIEIATQLLCYAARRGKKGKKK